MAVAGGLPHSAATCATAEVMVTSNAPEVRAFTGTLQLDAGCVTFSGVGMQRMERGKRRGSICRLPSRETSVGIRGFPRAGWPEIVGRRVRYPAVSAQSILSIVARVRAAGLKALRSMDSS